MIMHKYRSLVVWQRAHEALLLALTKSDAQFHPRSKALFEQLRRAVISIEANIVEGYALGTPPLFRRHLRIAMGSAAEAECLTRAAGELRYLSEDVVRELERLLDRTMAALHGLLRRPVRPGG
ncbi:MAG: four helix bundle protein [Gemmatimonadetes bacterium]|nr:MAG: four helix bundle protein [Gemmatimonadota bacterium]